MFKYLIIHSNSQSIFACFFLEALSLFTIHLSTEEYRLIRTKDEGTLNETTFIIGQKHQAIRHIPVTDNNLSTATTATLSCTKSPNEKSIPKCPWCQQHSSHSLNPQTSTF